MFSIIGGARFARFAAEGCLAIAYGPAILKFLSSRELRFVVILLIVLSIAGSAYSVYEWIRGSSPKRENA
jgi:hypothetical protein